MFAMYEQFLAAHRNQLQASGVPELYWRTLHDKLTRETFDAGQHFALLKVDYEDRPRKAWEAVWQVQLVSENPLLLDDPEHIYLVDHAWTFRPQQVPDMLAKVDGLHARMSSIMDTDDVNEELWRYANCYSVASAETAEERVPVWYVMDELGSGIQHSDDPNVRLVPFVHMPQAIAYTLLFPTKTLHEGDLVHRDFIEGTTNLQAQAQEQERAALLLPWQPSELPGDCAHVPADSAYFLGGHVQETLPDLKLLSERVLVTTPPKPLLVYAEYVYVQTYLTDSRFAFTTNEAEANILWLTRHFKDYKSLQPGKFAMVNQFPFEHVLTVKDLLPVTSRRNNANPAWLPETYNLKTELVEFVRYYQRNPGGYWIIKPFNLARSLDTHITNNLNKILRLQVSGPKVAQKYLERPLLFDRQDLDCNRVKFDIRYVVLLRSVRPLRVHIYKNFFLRFANVPYSLDDLQNYQKHFTVMNYEEGAPLKALLCQDFKREFQQQFGINYEELIETRIVEMISDLFICAVKEEPPLGIAHSPQSRALYAIDLMLDADMSPKLLEVNWTPDCRRACEYYPNFYNDVFKALFIDEVDASAFITCGGGRQQEQ